MIHFLVPRTDAFCIQDYLNLYAPSLAAHLSVEYYEDLPTRLSVPSGTYVFSTLDHLSPEGLNRHRAVSAAGDQGLHWMLKANDTDLDEARLLGGSGVRAGERARGGIASRMWPGSTSSACSKTRCGGWTRVAPLDRCGSPTVRAAVRLRGG